jgi:hypothetical protein
VNEANLADTTNAGTGSMGESGYQNGRKNSFDDTLEIPAAEADSEASR